MRDEHASVHDVTTRAGWLLGQWRIGLVEERRCNELDHRVRRARRVRDKGFRKPACVSLLGLLAKIKCVGVSPHSWLVIYQSR